MTSNAVLSPQPPVPPTDPAPTLSPRRYGLFAALAGVASALLTLAVAEVLALLFGGSGEPVLAVGSLIIDLVPAGFKTLVIDLFGTGDKLVLGLALGLLILLLAAAVGLLEARRRPLGMVLLGLVAAIAIFAVVTRAEGGPVDGIPTAAGAIGGMLLLRSLVNRLDAWRDVPPRRASAPVSQSKQYERRAFLNMLVIAGVASAVVGTGARMLGAAQTAVRDLRDAIRLPAPASAAPVIPASAELDVAGISPFVTPNETFYRIDTALQVPSVDPTTWKLRITGMVEEEVEISYDDLLALPLQEDLVTLTCVSNEVGGDLIGNALWLGYPIRELLAKAKPTAGADMVLSTSVDGFTASTPLPVLQDDKLDALLAVGMNGQPLPIEHGFPVRMVVPGLYGYVSATKWVTELKVTTFAQDQGYWTSRGWTAKGPIKLSSRIDVPAAGYAVKAGTVAVAGVAWAQHVGIKRVQVRIDSGAWQDATLATTVSVDSWLQWSFAWDATAGSHEIQVRSTDAAGLVQTADEAPPAPDGSSGYHTIQVQVN